MPKLSSVQVRNAKPRAKPYKLYDEAGLFLLVTPTGKPKWRMRYVVGGKEKLLSFGTYPVLSLADARAARNEARKQMALSIDPAQARRDNRLAATGREAFEALAREYVETRKDWSEQTRATRLRRLEVHIFPWLGQIPAADIKPAGLLPHLRRVEGRGNVELSHRMLQLCSQVFRFGVSTGRCDRDPAPDLRGALTPVKERHHAAVTEPRKFGELLRAIDGYQGTFTVKCALRLAPLVFLRPGELRHATWDEIDLEAGDWRIPAGRMKLPAPHIVPLAEQSIATFRELEPLTGPSGFVFPSMRTAERPMSENTVNAALRRLGYSKEEMTGHGFRSTASTLLNEAGWSRDAIERQLAHQERDKVRAAYNFDDYLPERRQMMRAWADYLDGLKSGATIVPLRHGAGA